MRLRALVEEWPSETMVYIAELPGCVATGQTAEVALEWLPDAVEGHLSWLAANGFVPAADELEIEVAERLTAADGRGPLFAADEPAVTDDELQHALRVSALARRDLVDVYRSVSALRRTRRPVPDGWSIAEHLLHVARLDLHYLAALTGDDVEPDEPAVRPYENGSLAARLAALPDDPVAALHASGELAARQLTALSPAERVACVAGQNGELWTARKIVRRMVGHQREHYPWVLALARG